MNKHPNFTSMFKRAARKEYLQHLRDGRKERAVVFNAKAGKGSYKRKPKHKKDLDG